MKIKFIVAGEPMGKQRPRFGKGFTYTPAKTVNYENWVKECYLLNVNGKHLEGEICANIMAYYSIPKSASKRNKELMTDNEIRPTKKPDTDNIAKIILDSLNNLAYKDDSQVVDLKVSKYYADQPRVEVELEEI